jgi:AcrR family transcriptional regulator
VAGGEDGLRERKKRETREAIVAAAFALFRAKGFEATSVDAIAEAAHVSTRTFFRYFPTKEDVVFLDQAEENEAFARELALERPGERDVDRVARAALAVARVAERNRPWFAEVYALFGATPSLVARSMQMQLEAEGRIAAALLARGRKDARRAARARLLAACAVAALRASHVQWIEQGGKGSLEKIVAESMQAVRVGFGAP